MIAVSAVHDDHVPPPQQQPLTELTTMDDGSGVIVAQDAADSGD